MTKTVRDAYEDAHTGLVMAKSESNALVVHIRTRVAALRLEADALEAILLKSPTKETDSWFEVIQQRRAQLRKDAKGE